MIVDQTNAVRSHGAKLDALPANRAHSPSEEGHEGA